jgi:hypothetical protein
MSAAGQQPEQTVLQFRSSVYPLGHERVKGMYNTIMTLTTRTRAVYFSGNKVYPMSP